MNISVWAMNYSAFQTYRTQRAFIYLELHTRHMSTWASSLNYGSHLKRVAVQGAICHKTALSSTRESFQPKARSGTAGPKRSCLGTAWDQNGELVACMSCDFREINCLGPHHRWSKLQDISSRDISFPMKTPHLYPILYVKQSSQFKGCNNKKMSWQNPKAADNNVKNKLNGPDFSASLILIKGSLSIPPVVTGMPCRRPNYHLLWTLCRVFTNGFQNEDVVPDCAPPFPEELCQVVHVVITVGVESMGCNSRHLLFSAFIISSSEDLLPTL